LKLTDAGYKKLLCETLQGKDKLKDIFDASSTNIIVVPILDVSYAENILVQLNALFPTYTFEVYGMPSWKNMNALKKPEAFPNIGVNISIPFYYDLSTGIGQAIANNYKKDAGGNKPPDMVFRGYETLYWYAYLLHKYGTVFNDKIADNGAAPFTRFDIKLKWDKDDNLYYLENKKIGIIRYQSSSYIVEQ
jgi:hypothetical protein